MRFMSVWDSFCLSEWRDEPCAERMVQLKKKTLSNFKWLWLRWDWCSTPECLLFVSGARRPNAGTWNVLFQGLNPARQELPCSFPKSEHVCVHIWDWQTQPGKPVLGNHSLMAACRSSGAGGAINPSSGSGREPSDDRMPKTIQFWCLPPIPVKPTVQSYVRWTFPRETGWKVCVPLDIPDRRATKLCVWGWESVL